MSEAQSSAELGSMRVAIGVDDSALIAGLKKGEAETKAAASRMGAAAKVNVGGNFAGGTGSTLFPGVDLPAAGGAPPSVPVEAVKQLNNEASMTAKAFRNWTMPLMHVEHGIMAITRAFGLVTLAVAGVGYALDAAFLRPGRKLKEMQENADKLRESIGKFGEGGRDLTPLQKELEGIDKEFESINRNIEERFKKGEISKGQRRGLTDQALQTEADRKAKAREDDRIASINKASDAQEKADADKAEFNRKAGVEETSRKLEEIDRVKTEEKNAQDERVKDANAALDQMDANRGRNSKLAKELEAANDLMQNARSEEEKRLAQMYKDAAIQGFKNAEREIALTIGRAVSSAFQASGGEGESFLGNQLTLLSQLGQKMDAVKSSIDGQLRSMN